MSHPNTYPLAEQVIAPTDTIHAAGRILVQESIASVETEPAPYKLFTNPYERMNYMHLTDDLIVTLSGKAETNEPADESVVYLDSSARPVCWMVNQLWDFANQDQLNANTRPLTLFANIDGRRTSGDLDPRRTTALYDTHTTLATWNDYSGTSDKRILIVDEIAVSGDTLAVAQKQFEAAFPNLTFTSYAWKDERNVPNDQRDNVRWYIRNEDKYRAVLDPVELKPAQKMALNERGITPTSNWLSIINPNQAGPNLVRDEVTRMVQEVTSNTMPFWPSNKRPESQVEALTANHNDGLSLQQFQQFRAWMKRYYAPTPLANLITSDAHGPLTEKEARQYMTGRQLKTSPPKPDTTTKKYISKLGYAAESRSFA